MKPLSCLSNSVMALRLIGAKSYGDSKIRVFPWIASPAALKSHAKNA
jgi:hypothetical protein